MSDNQDVAIRAIERGIADLEKRVEIWEDVLVKDTGCFMMHRAYIRAIYATVVSLAEHTGLSRQEVLRSISARAKDLLARDLETLENRDPTLAARIDPRPLYDEEWTPEA